MSRFECPGCGYGVMKAASSETDHIACERCGKIMLPILLPRDATLSTLPPRFKEMVGLSAAVVLAALGWVVGKKLFLEGNAAQPSVVESRTQNK